MTIGTITSLAKYVSQIIGLFTEGPSVIYRSVTTVDTITGLQSAPRRVDIRVSVKSYSATNKYGGGEFYWDAASTAAHNGGTVIAVTGVNTGRWIRADVGSAVLVDWFGAEPGNTQSQRAAIELADTFAVATNTPLSFRGGAAYYADELFIKSQVVLGRATDLVKTATTSQGFFNWGNRATGIVDGYVDGFNIDANGKDNVVNFRIYGNHTRPKIRNLKLKDCDFYALSVGGLSGQGDKADIVNGLDIDGVYIASERGNTALGTAYSFGLELFPGVLCKDWKIRNVVTVGKIINKIHWVDGLDMDHTNFKASSIFNSLSSGYCEINNCANTTIGQHCVFDTGGNNTYLALLIGGSRVAEGQAVTNLTMSGEVRGRVAFEKFTDITCTDTFKSAGIVFVYNVCGKLTISGSRLPTINTEPGKTGSVEQIILNSVTMAGAPRFDEPAIQIKELIINGGSYMLGASAIRLNNVIKTIMNGPTLLLNGVAPLNYAISVKNGTCEVKGMIMEGAGLWDRPILVLPNGSIRFKGCSFNNFVSSNLLSSGSLAITQTLNCDVNNVAI